MKKISIFLALASLAFAACNTISTDTPSREVAPDEIFCSVRGNEGVKSYFAYEGLIGGQPLYRHYWQLRDDISIFWYSGENLLFRCVSRSSDDNPTSGESSDKNKYSRFNKSGFSSTGSSVVAEHAYGAYPYQTGTTVTETDNGGSAIFNVNVPASQKFVTVNDASTFGQSASTAPDGTHMMGCAVYVARNETTAYPQASNYFNFQNVGCWLKLQLNYSGDNDNFAIDHVVMTPNDPAKTISGKANVLLTDGTITKVEKVEGQGVASVSLDMKGYKFADIPHDTGKTQDTDPRIVYIYLLPTDFSGTKGGFSLTFYDTTDHVCCVAKTSNEFIYSEDSKSKDYFQRNRVVQMSPIDLAQMTFVITVESWSVVDAGLIEF